MYYQVLIEINEKIGKSNTNKKIFEIDKTNRNDLIMDIVIPFLKKEEFQFNGYLLKPTSIVRFMVKTTAKSARELSQYENDNMPRGLIMYVSPEDIFAYDKYTTDITKTIQEEAKKMLTTVAFPPSEKVKIIDKTKVFIVHGHDENAKVKVARFIEQLNLKAIILHEQSTSGATIIEKIENYSDVGFAIVLYTPCDVGGKDEKGLLPRARQNVVFEHGYFIAKLGRNRVCALVKEHVEYPSDISGIVYIPLDSHDGWKVALAKEMRSAGYDIDFNLVI